MERLSPHIAKVTFSNPPARKRHHAAEAPVGEIGCRRGARGSELPKVRIKMSALDRDELLRLDSAI
jgi:hypothetical protein